LVFCGRPRRAGGNRIASAAAYTHIDWWISTRNDLSREEIAKRADEFFRQMAGQPSGS
jgi:hypothetical protein